MEPAGGFAPTPPEVAAVASHTDMADEALILYHTAKESGARHVVELGTRSAVSTRILSLALPEATIVTCDPEPCPTPLPANVTFRRTTGEALYAEYRRNRMQVGEWRQGGIPTHVDLLFVDTDPHSKEQTETWLSTWITLLSPEGVALWHDARRGTGVREALDDFARTHPDWRLEVSEGGRGIATLRGPEAPAFAPPPKERISIVVPTWGAYGDLVSTLSGIFINGWSPEEPRLNSEQGGAEVIVVSDGPDPECRALIGRIHDWHAAHRGREGVPPDTTLRYFEFPGHTGTGNLPRSLGLQQASGDWVMFLDAGSGLIFDGLRAIRSALSLCKGAQMLIWEVMVIGHPGPSRIAVEHQLAVLNPDVAEPTRMLCGIGNMAKRSLAQAGEWPNRMYSDHIFWSRIYRKLEPVPDSIAYLGAPVTVAYSDFGRRWVHGAPFAASRLIFPLPAEGATTVPEPSGEGALVP